MINFWFYFSRRYFHTFEYFGILKKKLCEQYFPTFYENAQQFKIFTENMHIYFLYKQELIPLPKILKIKN